jgi:hypothetical protein
VAYIQGGGGDKVKSAQKKGPNPPTSHPNPQKVFTRCLLSVGGRERDCPHLLSARAKNAASPRPRKWRCCGVSRGRRSCGGDTRLRVREWRGSSFTPASRCFCFQRRVPSLVVFVVESPLSWHSLFSLCFPSRAGSLSFPYRAVLSGGSCGARASRLCGCVGAGRRRYDRSLSSKS